MSLDVAFQHAFPDLTLDIAFKTPERGISALFGPSGVGKTTILRAIAGLLPLQTGRISVGGTALFESARQLDLPPHMRRLGLVFQDARLFPHLDVRGNLLFGAKRLGGNVSPKNVQNMAELLAIAPLLTRRIASLSGGEKQRVALGRALMTEPRALLLDEPLSGLDLPRKREIITHLKRLGDSLPIPILMVSHDVDDILALADHIILIEGGKVAASASTDDILREPDLAAKLSDGDHLLSGQILEQIAPELTRFQLDDGRVLILPKLEGETGAKLRLRIARSLA